MSKHKITATRSGSHPTMGDWDAEYTITFTYMPGVMPGLYPSDPADPGCPPEVEFVSIAPDAGDHGGFSDLTQKDLEDWATDWLQGDGYAAALEVAADDHERAREYAAELRAES